jgi:hypothetical protein
VFTTLTLTLMFTAAQGNAVAIESICHQVAPPHADGKWTRTPNRAQAVVLIRGYQVHLTETNVPKAELRPWQKPDSTMVKELAKNADVFVFAYGQNGSLDVVVSQSKLSGSIAQLRKLGYTDVALVGHSAGGLVARYLVEDQPDCGVTRVIQLAAPNGGSSLADLETKLKLVPKNQKAFVECLTIEHRRKCLETRADKLVPDKVQFICVVAKERKTADTDGVVTCVSQWTADLQKQGIPAVSVVSSHANVVRDERVAETVASLLRAKQERWPAERVAKAKKEILGK